ncbi:hypothetical protein COV05_01355 [Candidatus Uhrbacteria bacterium CG10_big_fil_rev_8_21_14_0_10_48_16]|uniref:Uncharacterized protein n=1 Tax=Candidatus Uhrbacteria bacterium CG10_big_fil_rev_8_21_14_0_10_48_16 TaxID=1975038 RepID=A0A2M8LHX7_9BACT|nr:MAG: hypothetical protein COV05_01355 [Candidatus Uhrbacteria bacterium CG10_big_fil_rev_8_21_14_0_10_48_16]
MKINVGSSWLFALQVIYPVLIFYFLVAASIVVDQAGHLEGLAFFIFTVGLVGVVYERIFRAVGLSGRALLGDMFWMLILPVTLPFVRWAGGGELNFWSHAVEASVYILVPTLPFLVEWLFFEKKKDVWVSMFVLLFAHVAQFSWFILFLIENEFWPDPWSITTSLFYVPLIFLAIHAWIKPLKRMRDSSHRGAMY